MRESAGSINLNRSGAKISSAIFHDGRRCRLTNSRENLSSLVSLVEPSFFTVYSARRVKAKRGVELNADNGEQMGELQISLISSHV